jgi:hypothetical protein
LREETPIKASDGEKMKKQEEAEIARLQGDVLLKERRPLKKAWKRREPEEPPDRGDIDGMDLIMRLEWWRLWLFVGVCFIIC